MASASDSKNASLDMMKALISLAAKHRLYDTMDSECAARAQLLRQPMHPPSLAQASHQS